MIEKINMETLAQDKEKTRTVRVFPDGEITLSSGVTEQLKLKDGDRIELFRQEDEYVEKLFIAKSNKKNAFSLRNRNDGGLKMKNINLSGMLISFLGIDGGEKSLAMRVYPEPHEFKEYNGYVAYQIIKK